MPKKRLNNTGSVYYEKGRGYRAQITTPGGDRMSKRFPDSETGQKSAHDWLHEQLHNMAKGTFIATSTITLGEWIPEYLRIYCRQNLRQRSFDRVLATAKHIAPLAEYKLQDLKPTHFQSLYVELGHFSGETRKKVHNLLYAAMRQAMRDGVLVSNPLEAVTVPKVVREEVTTFTKIEIETLLAKSNPHRWYPVLLLAVHTGARLGELLGLRWSDMDFALKTIHIRQTLQHASTGIIFEQPKTKASKRKIPIPKETAIILKNYRKKAMDQELCFTAANGSPIQPKNFERWFASLQRNCNPEWIALEAKRKALKGKKDTEEYTNILAQQKEALIARHKKFHAIRHTHATDLLAGGENIMEVTRRLGHSKASTTLDLYGHAIPGNDVKVAQKVAKLYKFEIEKDQSAE